ncbi:MAG: hypothetical protein K6E54_07090 [Bacteroidaceae bacterium]|nr:hypothetical protein [Bacteroidaceae bacterium]
MLKETISIIYLSQSIWGLLIQNIEIKTIFNQLLILHIMKKNSSYSAPEVRVQNSKIRTTILAGSTKVTGHGFEFEEVATPTQTVSAKERIAIKF